MSAFQVAFNKIAEGLKDLSSLEVITYKGTITINAATQDIATFDEILAKAKGEANFKLVACTKSRPDGDTKVYYDEAISADELAAHDKLYESATAKRSAVIQMFQAAILEAIKK